MPWECVPSHIFQSWIFNHNFSSPCHLKVYYLLALETHDFFQVLRWQWHATGLLTIPWNDYKENVNSFSASCVIHFWAALNSTKCWKTRPDCFRCFAKSVQVTLQSNGCPSYQSYLILLQCALHSAWKMYFDWNGHGHLNSWKSRTEAVSHYPALYSCHTSLLSLSYRWAHV